MGAHAAETLADWVLRTSWQSGVLIGVVAIALALLGKRIPARWRCAIWMIVAARLLLPALPSSRYSVFNIHWPNPKIVETEPARTPVDEVQQPRVTVGIISETLATPIPAAIAVSHQPATHSPITWRQILVAAWLFGVLIVLARFIVATTRIRRRIRFDGTGPDKTTRKLLDSCRREMRLATAPPIVFTGAVASPALFGIFRPVLLVPSALARELSAEELRFVLLHELAHYRRGDPLSNALLLLVEIVHWFNPLARFAVARCRAEREIACDALAMTASTESEAYGRVVLRVAAAFRCVPRPSRTAAFAVGMIQTRSQLRRRIAMIAAFKPAAKTRHAWAPLLVVLGVASCALTDGKPKSSSKSPAPPAARATAQNESEASPRRADAEMPPLINPQVQAALERTIPTVNFGDTPLDHVMDFFAGLAGGAVNVDVNWYALESAGIDRKTPVNLHLQNVRFDKAVRIVLDQVGGNKTALDFDVAENIITISTKEDVSRRTLTRVYDVRDLLVSHPDPVIVPELGKPQVISDRGPAAQSQPTAAAAPATRPWTKAARQIIDLIKETVEPDSWRDNGGNSGSIKELDGNLIVTQTPRNHQAVVDLLEKLRETRGPQIVVEGRYVRVDPAKLPAALRDKVLAVTGHPNDTARNRYLSDIEVAALVKYVASNREPSMTTMPRITLFNGQRSYVMVSTDTTFVSGFKPTKPGEKPEPELSSVSTGSIFDVAATVDRDRKVVQLKLRPRLIKLEKLEPMPFKGPPGTPEGLMVQVPMMSCHNVDTTVFVPDGRTVIVSAMMGPPDAPETAKEWSFLMVKPTILPNDAHQK